jgi:hypothetical protein
MKDLKIDFQRGLDRKSYSELYSKVKEILSEHLNKDCTEYNVSQVKEGVSQMLFGLLTINPLSDEYLQTVPLIHRKYYPAILWMQYMYMQELVDKFNTGLYDDFGIVSTYI